MARSCRWTPLGPIGLLTDRDNPGTSVMSGRATAIAIHPTQPDILYVGTAGGGVWKTVNAGRIWRPLTDREWSLAVGAIAIDPTDPDRIYVGTGEGNLTSMAFAGEGLLVSEDAGASWGLEPLPNPSSGRTPRVTSIIVTPAGDRLFIATSEALYDRRRNPDGTWSLTVVATGWMSDLVFDAASNRLYVGRVGLGVASWGGSGPLVTLGRSGDPAKQLPDPEVVRPIFRIGRVGLAWIASEPATLFAAYVYGPDLFIKGGDRLYGIYRSDDSGATWRTIVAPPADLGKGPFAIPDGQANYNLAFARNPHAPTDLLLGLVQFHRSRHLGEDWAIDYEEDEDDEEENDAPKDPDGEEPHVDQHTLAFSSRGEIWLGNDGGIWRSTDRGQRWRHRNRGLATMQFYGGAHDANVAALALGGSQDNKAQIYEGHPLWRDTEGGDVGAVAIDSANRRFWITTNDGAIRYNDRLAGSWVSMEHPLKDESGRFLAPLALAPSDPAVVYSGTRRLYRAEILNNPWWFRVPEYEDEGGGVVAELAVAHDDSRVVYIADMQGHVYRAGIGSLNSAVFELPALLPEGTAGMIADLAVSPRDSRRLYAVIGEQTASVFRDAKSRLFRWIGASAPTGDTWPGTWTDLTDRLPAYALGGRTRSPRENAIHAIVIDPDPAITDPAQERIYIGCDRGVFQSRDGGESWRALYDGLPPVAVYDLAFHPAERLLRAFTHGRSVWERHADIEPCPAAPPAGPEVDLYIRDQRYATGLRPTEAELLDPIRRDRPLDAPERRKRLHWAMGTDLKVDREALSGETRLDQFGDEEEVASGFQDPASTADYAEGPIDCIGFEALDHRDPRRRAGARVYLQMHNRGPDTATGVVARVYWATPNEDGSWPDLPAGFWSAFPGADPDPASPWKALGDARTIAEIRPAEPEVVLWEWNVPEEFPEQIGLLAIVTGPADAVFEGRLPGDMPRAVETLVRDNKRVILKRTNTIRAASRRSWRWLKWLGVAVLAGVAGWALYEGLDGD